MISSYGLHFGMIRSSFPAICLIVLCFTATVGGSDSVEYERLGCWRDTVDRAIPQLEGTDPSLDGSYLTRNNAIEKCYQVARSRGFTVFAVQDGGWCAGSVDGHNTYNKYGPSAACAADGEGGPWANEVYLITGALEETRRVCERQTLSLECTPGQMINVTRALYGRTQRELCDGPMYTTNCRSSSSLSTVRNYCQGHRTCSVPASNSVFGDPCQGTVKYLEVTYKCISQSCAKCDQICTYANDDIQCFCYAGYIFNENGTCDAEDDLHTPWYKEPLYLALVCTGCAVGVTIAVVVLMCCCKSNRLARQRKHHIAADHDGEGNGLEPVHLQELRGETNKSFDDLQPVKLNFVAPMYQ